MTVATMFLGLVPILWSTGAGAEVMKRIAAPMVGGLATSFLMELIVYPGALRAVEIPQAIRRLMIQCKLKGYTATMALNIRNPETENLAAELARQTGETKTEAVTKALRDRLSRVRRGTHQASPGR